MTLIELNKATLNNIDIAMEDLHDSFEAALARYNYPYAVSTSEKTWPH